jgi:gluconolactonase
MWTEILALVLATASAANAAVTVGTIERADPRFDALVPRNVVVEKVADGFVWVEGPVWRRDTAELLFSDIPNNAVMAWTSAGGPRVYLKPSGYTGTAPFAGKEPGSNGLTLDPAGRLVLCEHGDRRITRLEPDGRRTVLADRYQGRRLNSPNDAVFRSNGDLYFTDPPFGLPGTFEDPAKELPFSGVYRLTADADLALVTAELPAPNGIAFSPDEGTLYVSNADPRRPTWMAYTLRADGTVAHGRTLFDASPWTATNAGSADGIEVDRAGNLFAAGPGGLYVLAPDGTLLGRIILGVATANAAWGDDGSTLYVTASTAVYRIRLTTTGARF